MPRKASKAQIQLQQARALAHTPAAEAKRANTNRQKQVEIELTTLWSNLDKQFQRLKPTIAATCSPPLHDYKFTSRHHVDKALNVLLEKKTAEERPVRAKRHRVAATSDDDASFEVDSDWREEKEGLDKTVSDLEASNEQLTTRLNALEKEKAERDERKCALQLIHDYVMADQSDRKYSAAYKQAVCIFVLKCRSIRAAAEALPLTSMLTLGTPTPPHPTPHRSTITDWFNTHAIMCQKSWDAYTRDAPAFAIQGDGSTRFGLHLFPINVSFFLPLLNKPILRLLKLTTTSSGSADAAARLITSALDSSSLDLSKCIVITTDNASVNTGEDAGIIAQLSSKVDGPDKPYACPCLAHVIGISWQNARIHVYGSEIPNKEFEVKHLWNCYWLLYCLLGKKHEYEKIAKLIGEHIGTLGVFCRPVETRWQYELRCAEQAAEGYDAILRAADTLRCALVGKAKAQWSNLYTQLSDRRIFIRNAALIKMCKQWSKPALAWAMQGGRKAGGEEERLPSGFRAAEMPEKVAEWMRLLEWLKSEGRVRQLFDEEVEMMRKEFGNEEAEQLMYDMICAFEQEYESARKWLNTWFELPLLVAGIGSPNREFASALCRAILHTFSAFLPAHTYNAPPACETEKYLRLKLEFVDEMTPRPVSANSPTLKLLPQLNSDTDFFKEFLAFAYSTTNQPSSSYPILYSYIKNFIYSWPVTTIATEGLFNKWDMFIHRNMNLQLQQNTLTTREQLSCDLQFEFSNEQFAEQRALNEKESEAFGDLFAGHLHLEAEGKSCGKCGKRYQGKELIDHLKLKHDKVCGELVRGELCEKVFVLERDRVAHVRWHKRKEQMRAQSEQEEKKE